MAACFVLSHLSATVLGDKFMDNLVMPAETESYLQPGVTHTLDRGSQHKSSVGASG